MKDPILKGFIKDFAKDRGISVTENRFPYIFEIFSAYSILKKYHDFEADEPENQVVIGGSGDGGLDAVGILVNQRLVRSKEDVRDFLSDGGRFNVEYIFVQSKLSTSFSSESIGHFIYSVEHFFSDQKDLAWNDELRVLKEVSDYLLENTIHMYSNPSCYLYYITTGTWNQPREPDQRIAYGQQKLEDMKLFSKVHISPIDSAILKSVYRDLKYSVVKDIEFPNCATFPEIEGVQQAYIGLLSGDQYIRLISQDNGNLNRNLFYNNIRDFQGANAVNEEIHQTISSLNDKNNFPLMNNGITIVARSITRTGNRFTLADYQIVNGCQTTHVLYLNRDKVDSSVFVPTKLVATDDSRIIGEIIKANNRQTAIMPETWESLTPFHKELEDFYLHRPVSIGSDRVYYERRSKQYVFDNIPSSKIVTLPRQIQSFIGMFLNEPHSHHRYYGELLKAYDKRMFVEGHKLDPYYTSGVSLLAVEQLGDLADRGLNQYKYHLLMLIRIQVAGSEMPPLNSNLIANYCSNIVDCLLDRRAFLHQINVAKEFLRQNLSKFGKRSLHQGRIPPYRLGEFTRSLLETSAKHSH